MTARAGLGRRKEPLYWVAQARKTRDGAMIVTAEAVSKTEFERSISSRFG